MGFIQKEIEEIKKVILSLNIQQKEYLTLEETSVYFNLSKSWLHKRTSKKEIPFYKPKGKIYFKKLELENWISNSRIMPANELEENLENYLAISNSNLFS